MKDKHEAWVNDQLAEQLPEVGFAELEVVTRGLLAVPDAPTQDLTVVPPREKMARNGLTRPSEFGLSMGLSKAHEVTAFLNHVAAVQDPDFPERLKAGFVDRYRQSVAAGLAGDALYEAMREFAAPPRRPFPEQAAGLAVLAYLFEACEVFER
jgi:hypothetical protein